MKHKIKAALASAIMSAITLQNASAHLEPKANERMEKCFGVARAHKNDCATARHGCAGRAEKDGEPDEWVKVPSGLCLKLAGGSLTPKKENEN